MRLENPFMVTVDKLLLETGERKNKHWCGTLTTGEIIKELHKIDHTSHHRNIKTMVEMHYPGTKVEPIGPNGAQGWKLYIRVRTR